ncbi:MAG: hypothetical protein LUC31_00090 [Coprobacillus sp.]|nr:hypothetical protein [Coprobacillus sp.]
MLNLLIAILFAGMMGEYCLISVKVENYNYVIENIPLALVQQSVYLVNDPPFFNFEKLEDSLNDYFKNSLTNNGNQDYEVSYYYYDKDSGDQVYPYDVGGDDVYPTKVVVTLDADISVLYTYFKSMYYQIEGGSVTHE